MLGNVESNSRMRASAGRVSDQVRQFEFSGFRQPLRRASASHASLFHRAPISRLVLLRSALSWSDSAIIRRPLFVRARKSSVAPAACALFQGSAHGVKVLSYVSQISIGYPFPLGWKQNTICYRTLAIASGWADESWLMSCCGLLESLMISHSHLA